MTAQTINIAQTLQRAVENIRAGKFQDAEKICRQVLDIEPDNADANHMLGVIVLQVGKYEIAAALIAKAININPQKATYYNNLGNALKAQGKHPEAIEAYRRALNIKPGFVEPLHSLGKVYMAQGKLNEAEKSITQALKNKPDHVSSLNSLGKVYIAKGDLYSAEMAYKKALRIYPEYQEALFHLGNVYLLEGKLSVAKESCKQALKINPNFAEIHNTLGNIYKLQSNFLEAEKSYKNALTIKPDLTSAFTNLGNLYHIQGLQSDAAESYKKAINIRPKDAQALKSLGTVYKTHGKLTEAEEAYKRVLKINPDLAMCYYQLALLHNQSFNKPYYAKHPEVISKINQLLDREKIDSQEAVYLHAALGEIYDNCAMHDEAFENFRLANQLQHRTLNYDKRQAAKLSEEITSTFTENFFKQQSATGSQSPQPVFVVGLPRAGKSLVERLLSIHTQFYGGGELLEISRLVRQELPRLLETKESFPLFAHNIDKKTALETAQEYSNFLNKLAGNSFKRISNTLSTNFQLLGVIAMLFPRSRIIYCRRNLLDTCLAIYFKFFANGNEFANDLDEIAFHSSQYERIMQHWRNVLPMPIYEVHFEDLVKTPEKTVPLLIDFLGLGWDDDCAESLKEMTQHDDKEKKTGKQVISANHSRGIAWSEKYKKHLKPLHDSLQDYSPHG